MHEPSSTVSMRLVPSSRFDIHDSLMRIDDCPVWVLVSLKRGSGLLRKTSSLSIYGVTSRRRRHGNSGTRRGKRRLLGRYERLDVHQHLGVRHRPAVLGGGCEFEKRDPHGQPKRRRLLYPWPNCRQLLPDGNDADGVGCLPPYRRSARSPFVTSPHAANP